MNISVPQEQGVKTSLPSSLLFIVNELEKHKDFKPVDLRKIVIDAKVKPEDLAPWADLGHPVEDSYGRKLVYKGTNFEIMVMSWQPGDFSTIHDHGYTQWGAVQIFGPAEHATFRQMDDEIMTLARWDVTPGDVIGVSHSLIHQMGNPTEDTPFLSLHVYGDGDDVDNVTGDARVFDLENSTIQRVDGGVFFALPEKDIKTIEKGPTGDFPTRLRHMVELIRRLRKMKRQNVTPTIQKAFSLDNHREFIRSIRENIDSKGHHTNSLFWKVINRELQATAKLQDELQGETGTEDQFHQYAELYDAVICRPCMDSFIKGYLNFTKAKLLLDLSTKEIISIGCGTGMVEEFFMSDLGVKNENIYGIDISEAMVTEARKRIRADVGDVLTLDPGIKLWDIAFSGLNVFHYLDFNRLEEAIQKTAAIIKPGGYFIGDFITPDHIRWYPNVLFSDDEKIISLRNPELIEDNGRMFQESEITNVSFTGDMMRVSYAGKHRRFLPPMHRIRHYFEKAFKGEVELYDAHTLQVIPDWADSCASTRYVVLAKKQ